jgi:hypothetical protein
MFGRITSVFAAMALLLTATPAFAGDIKITPVALEGQTIRYQKGTPTVEDDLAGSAVRVMPLPDMDHGSLQFIVVAYNKGQAPVNLGSENVYLSRGTQRLDCFTKDQLEKQAKNRAMWSQIGMAMLTGVAAGLQDNNTYIATHSRYGSSYTTIRSPGLSNGQLATLDAGAEGIAASQAGLQRTLDNLNDEILQTSTIDPASSYGGRVVVNKIKGAKYPENVSVVVDFGGEIHTFNFTVTK